LGLKNVFRRKRQFALADEPLFCLNVAREFVAATIRNQRAMLRRNHLEPPPIAAGSAQTLRVAGAQHGQSRIVGDRRERGADLLRQLCRDDQGGRRRRQEHAFYVRVQFTLRTGGRRPIPVNALLSFAYSLLAKDLTIICHSVGLDPFIGFFRQPRFGRPALALDPIEGFRPLIADSVVSGAINNGMVGPGDFFRVEPAVALTPAGRKGSCARTSSGWTRSSPIRYSDTESIIGGCSKFRPGCWPAC
jgi:CRISP-associated protein Cas1